LRGAGGRLPVPELLRRAGAARATLRSLERCGLVEVESLESARRPVSFDLPLLPVPGVTPTPAQAESIEAVRVALEAGKFATFLLHGVTGSGKTEVYLRAIVVLGSATPAMESYTRAQHGRYRLLALPGRIGSAGLPPVERVDMRSEFKEVGRESVLSRRLLAALQERLRRGEQSLVLLNRR